MAKLYTKQTWQDEVLAGSERYNISENDGTPINSNVQISLSTGVTTAGTAADAAHLQHIEDGIDAVDTRANDLLTEITNARGGQADVDTRIDNIETEITNARAGLGNLSERFNTYREKLSANRTYYVRTDGSDSNNGLANTSDGAFLTLQKAVDAVAALDLGGKTVTIQAGDNLTGYAGVTLKTVVGYSAPGCLILQGNTSSPSNCIIDATSGNAVHAENIGQCWDVKGFKLKSTSGYALFAGGAGTKLRFDSIHFNACGAYHMRATAGGVVSAQSNYLITGNAPSGHILCDAPGSMVEVYGRTITFSVSMTVAQFVNVTFLAFLNASSMTFTLGANTVTGTRYVVQANAVISSYGGASYFPGTVAGTPASGGQYI